MISADRTGSVAQRASTSSEGNTSGSSSTSLRMCFRAASLGFGNRVSFVIAAETSGRCTPAQRRPFRYRDKGSLATIGKARAVAQIGRFHFTGPLAWVLWGVVHITFLINFRNRLQVLLSWFWDWLINARDARLITGDLPPHAGPHFTGEVQQETQPPPRSAADSQPDRAPPSGPG